VLMVVVQAERRPYTVWNHVSWPSGQIRKTRYSSGVACVPYTLGDKISQWFLPRQKKHHPCLNHPVRMPGTWSLHWNSWRIIAVT